MIYRTNENQTEMSRITMRFAQFTAAMLFLLLGGGVALLLPAAEEEGEGQLSSLLLIRGPR